MVTLPVLEALRAAHSGVEGLVVGHPLFGLAAEAGLVEHWLAFDDARLVGLFAEAGRCDLVAGADLCIVYGRREDPTVAASPGQRALRPPE